MSRLSLIILLFSCFLSFSRCTRYVGVPSAGSEGEAPVVVVDANGVEWGGGNGEIYNGDDDIILEMFKGFRDNFIEQESWSLNWGDYSAYCQPTECPSGVNGQICTSATAYSENETYLEICKSLVPRLHESVIKAARAAHLEVRFGLPIITLSNGAKKTTKAFTKGAGHPIVFSHMIDIEKRSINFARLVHELWHQLPNHPIDDVKRYDKEGNEVEEGGIRGADLNDYLAQLSTIHYFRRLGKSPGTVLNGFSNGVYSLSIGVQADEGFEFFFHKNKYTFAFGHDTKHHTLGRIAKGAGELDDSFSGNGLESANWGGGSVYGMKRLSNGQTVVTGRAVPAVFNPTKYQGQSYQGVLEWYSSEGLRTGYRYFSVGFYVTAPVALAVRDSKIYTVGYIYQRSGSNNQLYVSRHNADGTFDSSFGNGGKVIMPEYPAIGGGILVEQDGKILVSGIQYTRNPYRGEVYLLRLNPDGTLDESFAEDGKFKHSLGTEWVSADKIRLDSQGRYLVGIDASGGAPNWVRHFAMIRLLPDGTLDQSFAEGGILLARAQERLKDFIIQPNGKIVTIGSDDGELVMRRLETSGVPDTSFGTSGKIRGVQFGETISNYQFPKDIRLILHPNGTLTVGGRFYKPSAPSAARYGIAILSPIQL